MVIVKVVFKTVAEVSVMSKLVCQWSASKCRNLLRPVLFRLVRRTDWGKNV